MNYDQWKATEPDYLAGERPDDDDRCPECGAKTPEDCAPDCQCIYCRAKREQNRKDAA